MPYWVRTLPLGIFKQLRNSFTIRRPYIRDLVTWPNRGLFQRILKNYGRFKALLMENVLPRASSPFRFHPTFWNMSLRKVEPWSHFHVGGKINKSCWNENFFHLSAQEYLLGFVQSSWSKMFQFYFEKLTLESNVIKTVPFRECSKYWGAQFVVKGYYFLVKLWELMVV